MCEKQRNLVVSLELGSVAVGDAEAADLDQTKPKTRLILLQRKCSCRSESDGVAASLALQRSQRPSAGGQGGN